jgi:hypothetical protein
MRSLMRHLPHHRDRSTWSYVAADLEKAAAGVGNVEVSVALRLALMLDGVPCAARVFTEWVLVMALIDMSWTQISIHNVVSEWLRAERESFSFYPPWVPFIDNPDLNDPLQNHKRLRLLYLKRGNFMVEIPPDTTWWNVRSLSENELGQLHVSARHNPKWDVDGYKLESVAAVVRESLKSSPDTWTGRIILWGHSRGGPFSILEGNHRMLAYAHAAPRSGLSIDVYVGLSDSYCYWHFADPGLVLGNDLYKREPQIIETADRWLVMV